jgi:hypothetical protein
VEGPVGRAGASGVGGMAAGDGLALGGFWPATFPLLSAENRLEQSSYAWYEGKLRLYLLPLRQIYSGGMLGHGIQMAA